MKLIYIGAGFVGACAAAASADSGHKILLFDIDEIKIKRLSSGDRDIIESCLYEKGLGDLLVRNKENITFSSKADNFKDWCDDADAIFICVPTPEKDDSSGETDLRYYKEALSFLALNLKNRNSTDQSKYLVVINKSTVPISAADYASEELKKNGVKNFGIASNPEFLVEGKAIEGSIKPDRIVIGAWNDMDFQIMRKIYARFYQSPNVDYIEVNPKEAAAGKLLANYILLSRLVTTYGVIGRLTESFNDLKFENVRKIISSDSRIGPWGLFDSVYAGGSCLTKDAASLKKQLTDQKGDASQVVLTIENNIQQLEYFYNRASANHFNWKNKTIAVMGLAFKRDTNDVRNSAAYYIVPKLIDDGINDVRVYDPAAMPMFKSLFDPEKDDRYKVITYHNSESEALKGSDACMILTDWPKFRELGGIIQENCKPPYLIMDGRRMLASQFEDLVKKGYDIIAVGSPTIVHKVKSS